MMMVLAALAGALMSTVANAAQIGEKIGVDFDATVNPNSGGAGLPSVRVIEDGDIRTVIEAVLGYQDSSLCLRYLIPKAGTEIGIEIRVDWGEQDTIGSSRSRSR